MTQPETINKSQAESQLPETASKPCESGADQTPKKKKLSLDIEEIGEVLERKISP
jgi:hypothetical protein